VRAELLHAAIEHVAHHGLADLSLRSLAAELGTSHRMLIHHFGSKEALWVAIVREVERRQLETMRELILDAEVPFDELMRTWWRHISDPSLWPHEKLFFEIYAAALQRRAPARDVLDGIVDSWLSPAADVAATSGRPVDDVRTDLRLGLAVTRGLLLDLLATEDRAGVDAAMERWIELHPSAAGRRGRGR